MAYNGWCRGWQPNFSYPLVGFDIWKFRGWLNSRFSNCFLTKNICIYIYIYMYMYVYIYIYLFRLQIKYPRNPISIVYFPLGIWGGKISQDFSEAAGTSTKLRNIHQAAEHSYQVKLLDFFPRASLKTLPKNFFSFERVCLKLVIPQPIRVWRLKVWRILLQEPTAELASPQLQRPKPPISLLETKHRKLLASGMDATWDEWNKIWNSGNFSGNWPVFMKDFGDGIVYERWGYRDIRCTVFPSMLVCT